MSLHVASLCLPASCILDLCNHRTVDTMRVLRDTTQQAGAGPISQHQMRVTEDEEQGLTFRRRLPRFPTRHNLQGRPVPVQTLFLSTRCIE